MRHDPFRLWNMFEYLAIPVRFSSRSNASAEYFHVFFFESPLDVVIVANEQNEWNEQ